MVFKKRIHQIDLFKKYPVEVQNETLNQLLKSAQNTEFGKKYDFKTIKNENDFAQKVPVTDYENFF